MRDSILNPRAGFARLRRMRKLWPAIVAAAGLALAAFAARWEGACGRAPPVDETLGQEQFENYCAPCHHPDGLGMEDGAPPLRDSPWVAGPESRLVRILLHGVRGPIRVGDEIYDLEMPPFGEILSDADIASVLSFVRRRCGGPTRPLEPATVSEIRAATSDRMEYWTAEDLLEIP